MHGRLFQFKGQHCTQRAAERSRKVLRRHWWYVQIIQTECGWYRLYVSGAKVVEIV